jgi:hypothetical protein
MKRLESTIPAIPKFAKKRMDLKENFIIFYERSCNLVETSSKSIEFESHKLSFRSTTSKNTPYAIYFMFKMFLEMYPSTTNFSNRKKVRFMIYFHHFQCIAKDIFCNNHRLCFVYSSHVPKHGKGHRKAWENV